MAPDDEPVAGEQPDDEPVEAAPEFTPRQAGKGATVEFADAEGNVRSLKADKRGWITANDQAEEAVLAGLGFRRKGEPVDSDEPESAGDADAEAVESEPGGEADSGTEG